MTIKPFIPDDESLAPLLTIENNYPAEMSIDCQADLDISREHVKALLDLRARIETYHAPLIQQHKAYKALLAPVQQRIKSYRAQQSEFLTQQRVQEKQQLDDFQSHIAAERNKTMIDKAAELVAEGNINQAQKLVAASESQQLSIAPIQSTIPNTTTRWSYKVLDVNCLNPHYITPTPNRGKILETVTEHGKDAETVVGIGSIKVSRKTVPVYRKD